MKRAVITGAAGFIGRKLWERLEKEGVPVVPMDLVLGHDLTKEAYTHLQVDRVYHLAGCSDAYQDPSDCIRVNILSTLNVLRMCRTAPAVLIFASTYLEQGPYAASKRCCESTIQAFGVPSEIVRCCNVYGPGDKNTKRVVPSLISKMLKNEPVQLTNCHRDFVFIDDVVDAYWRIGKEPSQSVYQIGGSGLIPLGQVAAEIKELTGSTSEIRYMDVAQDAPNQNLTAMREVGWVPKTSMREGLQKTIDWWKTL